ncbi:MAG: STAS/SEC14 domain-containing protein [Pseudomonadota bacterium]|nr:STAS/SEC14 domain-containing protein [Pseudomonadota bacterium]
MLTTTIDQANGIAILEPHDALSKDDFVTAAHIIDPYIGKQGKLNGLIIYTESFPGWDSFAALSSHLAFVKEHHKKINRIAFVTDSPIGNLAESIATHFVNAQIRSFPFEEIKQAKFWIGRF